MTSGKETIRDRERKKKTVKEVSKAGQKKGAVTSGLLLGAEKSQDMAKSYLSTGSEDNVGVEGAEKTLDTGSKLIHQRQKSFNKRKAKEAYSLSENDYKLREKKPSLSFEKSWKRLRQVMITKRARPIRGFKRRQMKASIKEKNHTRLRDRIKEGLKS